jgi:hypothetical protein
MTMPNFLVIGAMKAGTTALYSYLEQHPDVYMSPVKEPNFFCFEGERPGFRAPQDQEGINRTSVTDIDDYRALFRGTRGEAAIGEASHWYLYHPKAPGRIRHHIPEVRLIAVLRNPVERAYSQFLHFVRDGQEPLTDFAQALRAEDRRIRDHWAFGRYASRGFYYSQLKRYYDLFDRDQIKVYLYEDLRADAPALLRDSFRFVGVDPTFVPELSVEPNVSGIPRNRALHAMLTRSGRTKAVLKQHLPAGMLRLANGLKNRNLAKPELSPELRLEMTEMYREDILKLEGLIDRDLSNWLGSRKA